MKMILTHISFNAEIKIDALIHKFNIDNTVIVNNLRNRDESTDSLI